MAVDLHTHTTFSDGTLTPEELVQLARKSGLTAIAITDHDEIGANKIAQTCAKNYNVEVVPGIELSIDFPLPGRAHLHMLGLFVDPENDRLNHILGDLSSARRERAHLIIERLREKGLDVSVPELEELIGPGSAGRPHIARLLVKKGYITSVYDGFRNYLSKGSIGYVPKKKLNLSQAIDLVHHAGGLTILAHPISLDHKTYAACEKQLDELKAMGLDGVEAYYSTHSKNFTKYLINAAERIGLAVSGGSDFHGATKPDIALGKGKGNLLVPDEVLDNLKRYKK